MSQSQQPMKTAAFGVNFLKILHMNMKLSACLDSQMVNSAG